MLLPLIFVHALLNKLFHYQRFNQLNLSKPELVVLDFSEQIEKFLNVITVLDGGATASLFEKGYILISMLLGEGLRLGGSQMHCDLCFTLTY